MREELLAAVERDLEALRQAHEQEEERRKLEIREKHPEIFRLTQEREEIIFGSIRGILRGQAAPDGLPERMAEASERVRGALRDAGYPEDWLSPIVNCPDCRDLGYTGEPVRKMCDCMRKAYQRKLREKIGLGAEGRETFENYNANLFPDEALQGMSFSQRRLNQLVRKACEEWADTWPAQRPSDLLLSGPAGVGKTWFLRAMAARLIERDCQVLLISAYTFVDVARKSYFENDGGLEELTGMPVLMIDDLGSEPLMKNVTVEQLFNLINERRRRNLATVYSTNLDAQGIQERYSERIASRLTDPHSCNYLRLPGRDVRTGRE